MYAFILLGGASAWYLLYKYCCGKQREEEDTVVEEQVELIIHPKDKVDDVDDEDKSHIATCELVAKKLVDTLIHDVVERIEKREEEKSDHKIKLNQVHQDLNQNYPKYLHHKVLQELNNRDTDVSAEEGSDVSAEEGSAKSTDTEDSLWDDLGEKSVVEKPLFNSRLIYAEEDIEAKQVKYWFDANGNESFLTYDQLVEQNGVFNVKRINNNNKTYYFFLFASKEKQE